MRQAGKGPMLITSAHVLQVFLETPMLKPLFVMASSKTLPIGDVRITLEEPLAFVAAPGPVHETLGSWTDRCRSH